MDAVQRPVGLTVPVALYVSVARDDLVLGTVNCSRHQVAARGDAMSNWHCPKPWCPWQPP
jgi:hypothetical protein